MRENFPCAARIGVVGFLSAGPSGLLWLSSNFRVNGATGAKYGPSFGPVVEVPIDEILGFALRSVSYF